VVPVRRFISPSLPPLALMAVIFFFSSQPDLDSGLGLVDTIGRKLVHAGEYALLCWLWWRALRIAARPRAALLAAFAITVGYAASDELHQTFVAGRHGSPIDVAIDTLGASLAALMVRRREARSATGRLRATASRAG